MLITRYLSFLFSLIFFYTIAESSPFSDSKKACYLEQPNPKATPAREAILTQKTVFKTELDTESKKIISSEIDCSAGKKMYNVAVSFTVVSALMSYKAAKSYNDLSSKNRSLATRYKNSSKSSEKARYKSEYDKNSRKMKTYKNSMQTWDLLTLAGLGWNFYLLMTNDSEDNVSNYKNSFSPLVSQFVIKRTPFGPQTIFHWKWRF